MNQQQALARVLIANLLEDEISDDVIADQYLAWVLQRGGSGVDLSTLKAWIRHFYPDKLASADTIFNQVRRSAAA